MEERNYYMVRMGRISEDKLNMLFNKNVVAIGWSERNNCFFKI